MNYSCDLLFALSLEYNIFVYLLQRKIMLEKDNFHHLVSERVLEVSQVAYNVLNNDLQLELMARCGKACGKKAYNDLNYVRHETIHIDLSFTRSRESKHMKILRTEMQLKMILY